MISVLEKMFRSSAVLLLAMNCGCTTLSDDVVVMELGVGEETSSLSAYRFPQEKIGFFLALDRAGEMWATDYGSSVGPGGVAGDTFFGEHQESKSYSAGITHLIKERIGIYGGYGYVDRSDFCTYYDDAFVMSPSGFYHVDCGSSSTTGFVIGAQLFVNDVWTLGYRHNLAIDEEFITIGMNIENIDDSFVSDLLVNWWW